MSHFSLFFYTILIYIFINVVFLRHGRRTYFFSHIFFAGALEVCMWVSLVEHNIWLIFSYLKLELLWIILFILFFSFSLFNISIFLLNVFGKENGYWWEAFHRIILINYLTQIKNKPYSTVDNTLWLNFQINKKKIKRLKKFYKNFWLLIYLIVAYTIIWVTIKAPYGNIFIFWIKFDAFLYYNWIFLFFFVWIVPLAVSSWLFSRTSTSYWLFFFNLTLETYVLDTFDIWRSYEYLWRMEALEPARATEFFDFVTVMNGNKIYNYNDYTWLNFNDEKTFYRIDVPFNWWNLEHTYFNPLYIKPKKVKPVRRIKSNRVRKARWFRWLY